MESLSVLLAFWLGASTVILILALVLGFKLLEFLKVTVRELMDKLKKL